MNELQTIADKCEIHYGAEQFQVINGAFIPPLLNNQYVVTFEKNVAILTSNSSNHIGLDWLKFNGELVLDYDNKPALREGFFLQVDHDLMRFAEYFGYSPPFAEDDEDEDEDKEEWYDYLNNASHEEIFAACVMRHNEMTFDMVNITPITWPRW
jgi:hypothetical protein